MRLAFSLPSAIIAGLTLRFAMLGGQTPRELANDPAPAEEVHPEGPESPKSGSSTGERVQRLMSAALREGASSERDNEVYVAIEAFTAEDFSSFLGNPDALKALSDKFGEIDYYLRDSLVSALAGRWLSLDPSAAVAWFPRALETLPFDTDLRAAIIDVFSTKRPSEVLALVKSRKDAADRAALISGSLRELAKRDLTKANAWLKECTDAEDREVAEKAVRAGTVEADPLRVIEVVGSIEDRGEGGELLELATHRAEEIGSGVLRKLASTPMKPWMLGCILYDFAELDPEAAVDLAVNSCNSGDKPAFGMKSAFSALADRDPLQAIAKIDGLKGFALSAAVSAIGETWAARDPAAALTWLAGRADSERRVEYSDPNGNRNVLAFVFGDWFNSSPEAARAWADALSEGETRSEVQVALVRSLAGSGDGAEAIRVLEKLGNAANPKLVEDVSIAWARRDAKAAAEWATSQSPGTLQSRALGGVVKSWANDDPKGVETWLAQFPPGEARDRSICAFLERDNLGTVAASQQIAEFDKWFEWIEDPWQRATVARSSFWLRKQSDPAGARAWLTVLPNVDPEVVRLVLID